MFTNCPTCTRQFRIRASQLATAEGLVQCGFCGKQFNALERLYDKPLVIDDELMAMPLEEETAEPDFYLPEIEDDSQEGGDGENLEHTLEEIEAVDKLVGMPAEPVVDRIIDPVETESEIVPVAAEPVITENADTYYPFPDELTEEPAPQANTVSRLFWSFGVLLLFLAGTAQAGWFNRDILLSQYPQFLPQARQVCQKLNCTLIRNRNISAIKILNRDVRIHPRFEDALLVNVTITNLSKTVQRFPMVLLRLFDTNGEVIAYRQIPASGYLDSSIDLEAGMVPDTPIHFVFEVANSSTDAVSFEFDFL